LKTNSLSTILLATLLAVFASTSFAPLASAKSVLNVPAVGADGTGILTRMEAEVVSSNLTGVFIDVKPFVSVETQQSAELAAKIAARKANVKLEGKTVLFKIIADAEIVDGPSGGAALTLLAYAEFANKSSLLRRDLAVTGSIEQDASIGKIGGVEEKVRSAIKRGGIKLFIVPLGQSKSGGVDLKQLGEANGMQVVEAADFSEVIRMAFTPEGSRVVEPKHVKPPLVLETAPAVSKTAQEMRVLAQQELNSLENLSKKIEALSAGNNSIAKNVNDSVAEALNTTRYLLSKDYLYSAANLAFVTKINSEAFLLENTSRKEFENLLNQLQAQLQPSFEKKFSTIFNKATLENWEWIAGAQARYHWARKKAAEVKLKLDVLKNAEKTGNKTGSQTSLTNLIADYLSARNWLQAAEKMVEIAGRTASGKLANEANARANVLEVIKAANETLSTVFDEEAEWHLQAAEQAFNERNYFGASIDACFALSFARARVKALEAVGEDFNVLLENASGFSAREGVWAQLYFVHSLFLKVEGNRSRDFSFYFNALRLQELSECLTANARDFEMLLAGVPLGVPFSSVVENESSGRPLGSKGFEVKTVVVESSREKLFLVLNVVLAVLLAVAVVVILRLHAGKRDARGRLKRVGKR